MSTKPSELMLGLLQELAKLKEVDRSSLDEDAAERESREKRRQEICEQIKALGGSVG